MTPLEAALADYLRLRRALGHKLDDAGRQLSRFVTYLDFIGAETVFDAGRPGVRARP